MTSLKMIVCGDRTTTDVTDEVITFGDRSSNVYKKAFELIKREEDKRNGSSLKSGPETIKEFYTIPVILDEFPVGFSISGVIEIHNQKHGHSAWPRGDTERDVSGFCKHGTVMLVSNDPDTKLPYASIEVPWVKDEEGNMFVVSANIPPFPVDPTGSAWCDLTMNMETATIRYELAGTPISTKHTYLLLKIPTRYSGVEAIAAIEEITDTDEVLEIASIIEDIDFDKPTPAYSYCNRPGNRELNKDNVVGVVRSEEYKHNGLTITHTFVYQGDSAYLINDKGNSLDRIK